MANFPVVDELDRRILMEVQIDNRQSSETLGEKVGASPSTVQRRLARLRETGVIESDISVVAEEAVGWPMTFIVEVVLERERVDLLDAFRESMRKLEEVQQCYYVTGDIDFIMIVSTEDMKSYEDFSRRVFIENPNLKSYASHVVVNRVKGGRRVNVMRQQQGNNLR